jgi:uncharacterized protein (TIGR03086 family)
MTGPGPKAALTGGVALLERAIGYTLGSLQLVREDALGRPTPCRDWDLRSLLRHMDSSLAVLAEAVDCGRIEPEPDRHVGGLGGKERVVGQPMPQPVAVLRDRACRLLGAWAAQDRYVVRIGDTDLPAALVTGTGAIEIAVHGWDVAEACGQRRPVPPALAAELLEIAVLVVTDSDRPDRFGPPIPIPATAAASDRLLAFLGRPE